MALTSPGVEVSVIDESQYLPGATASIPFFLLATAQDKADPTSTATAAATTSANASKLYRVTSQRDLVTLYGNPFFYTASNGTPLQGYELNEYGLLAAYSALGISNQIFVLRADIDLASLVGSTGRPTGAPTDGSFWLDTTSSTWGINEFNETTGAFTVKTPIVISDSTLVSVGTPLQSVGSIGDYAVVSIPNYRNPNNDNAPTYWYKNSSNTWVGLDSEEWMTAWPTITCPTSSPTLTEGDTINLVINATNVTTLTVAASPNNTITQLAADINALNWGYISAGVVNNKLAIYSAQTGGDQGSPATPFFIRLNGATGTIFADLGFTGSAITGFQPRAFYGTSAQQPLWQSGQAQPATTGSVWVKVDGTGLQPVISEYDSVASSYTAKTPTFATSDWSQIYSADTTGGQAIPAGSVYAQYAFNGEYEASPIYYFYRAGTGATVINGTNAAPDFTSGPYVAQVQISTPGSIALSSGYTFNLGDATDATDFVTAWSAANIPYTSASVNDDGSLQISHTSGGVIVLDDFDGTTGISSGLFAEAGFSTATVGCKNGPFRDNITFQPVQGSTTGAGAALQISVTNDYGYYDFDPDAVVSGGTGHAVGDRVTFLGSALGGVTTGNDLVVTITSVTVGVVTSYTWESGKGADAFTTQLSNWREFSLTTTGANSLTANEGAPTAIPTNFTNWFYSSTDQVDIMINYDGNWKGYQSQGYDSNGLPSPGTVNATDPKGPLVSASEPTTQSDSTVLVYGDIWLDTSDLETYPNLYRWQSVPAVGGGSATDKWVLIDNSDQTSPQGILFKDTRWATNGTTNPANDPIPSIVSLLSSDYLDIDAPLSANYPQGMLIWNTRRSSYNVKQYRINYFNADRFPTSALPTQKDAWVSASGDQSNGAMFAGRKAQRAMVTKALRSSIDTNVAIRDEDNYFNLQATPGYPELQPNMIALNSDRGETSYIVGDTPMRLKDDATEIQAWATNAAAAVTTGEDGLVSRNTYMGLFYPSGITSDLSGNLVAVPSSHMMTRTMLRNDNIAYPWLAPAGTRRGIIDNATSIGYIDAEGEFNSIRTRIGIRDVLYTNFINPMVFFTGNGLLNYGNKTSYNSSSALDRVNVARLVAYIRRQLILASRPFVFEPNDPQTRKSIKAVVETLFQDLVSKRGLYDYSVVCDDSNNTPARIDRNELWIDIAVEPVKAAEFIYVPVRIFNTGELSGS
jgi:hypothetical protein